MKAVSRLMCASALLFAQSGCATIVSDKSYPVTFISEPAGAKVEVKDQKGVTRFSGVTPTTATLDAGNGYFTRARYTVTSSKEGYTPATQQISSSLDGWYWGNILVGGLIGMLIVDPISGAMFEIDTPSVTLTMSKASENGFMQTSAAGGSDVYDQLQRLKKLKDEGLLTEAEYKAKKKAVVKDL